MRVSYKHFRYDKKGLCRPYHRSGEDKTVWTPKTKGGMTICTLTNENGLWVEGVAVCSLDDSFNYQRGREIAYGRARRKMGL